MKESGSTTIWKARDSTSGTMAAAMKASTKTIRNTGSASTPGQTAGAMKVTGGKENNMA